MNDRTNSPLGPPVEPPDDVWASALSDAIDAGPDQIDHLADLVPPAGELSDEVWRTPTEPDAPIDPFNDGDRDPERLDPDPDPSLDSAVDDEGWWEEDTGARPDLGPTPDAAPDRATGPEDAGGWA